MPMDEINQTEQDRLALFNQARAQEKIEEEEAKVKRLSGEYLACIKLPVN